MKKKEAPSIDQWLKEAKADPAAADCGMFLVHNGTVRQADGRNPLYPGLAQ